MTLEELAKALGIDGEEDKEKFATLKKEFNAKTKEVNKLTETVSKMTEEAEATKEVANKLNTVVTAFGVDLDAKDFDESIENAKENIIKEAGGGATPDEIKELNRALTKAKRDADKNNETIAELTEQLGNEKTLRLNGVKRDAIHKALLHNNIIEPEQSIDLFFNRVLVDEDGSTVTMKGSDGSELSVNDAIADWAKEHPKYVERQVKGGAGSGGKGGNGSSSEVSPFMKSLLESRKTESAGSNTEGKDIVSLFG